MSPFTPRVSSQCDQLRALSQRLNQQLTQSLQMLQRLQQQHASPGVLQEWETTIQGLESELQFVHQEMSADDPNFPFANGQLSNADEAFNGFDVGDPMHALPMKALPGTIWHDVMTYCLYQWLSSYAYAGILTRLNAENALAAHGASPGGATPGGSPQPGSRVEPAAAQGASPNAGGMPDLRFPANLDLASQAAPVETSPFINVIASVNLSKKSGKILYVNPVSQGQESHVDEATNASIRMLNAAGELIGEYHVQVKLDSCIAQGEDQTGLVNAFLPYDPRAKGLELLVSGQVADTFGASDLPPTVRNLRPTRKLQDAVMFEWDGHPQAAGRQTYNVQVSTDMGRTWQTLAVGRASPSVTIDKDQFQGAKSLRIRVIATDGFNQWVQTSEPMAVGGP